jgi:hypothetical protein
MQRTQVKAKFYIISEELSLKQMTDILGFDGDCFGDKDDVLNNGLLRGQSYIELCTGYEDLLDIYGQYNKIIIRLKKLKTNVLNALEAGKVWCNFCIIVKIENGYTPAMTLNNELIYNNAHNQYHNIYDNYI